MQPTYNTVFMFTANRQDIIYQYPLKNFIKHHPWTKFRSECLKAPPAKFFFVPNGEKG